MYSIVYTIYLIPVSSPVTLEHNTKLNTRTIQSQIACNSIANLNNKICLYNLQCMSINISYVEQLGILLFLPLSPNICLLCLFFLLSTHFKFKTNPIRYLIQTHIPSSSHTSTRARCGQKHSNDFTQFNSITPQHIEMRYVCQLRKGVFVRD